MQYISPVTLGALLSPQAKQCFPRIYSTKESTSTNADCYADKGDICLTQRQTQGRGRHGRKWHDLSGEQIFFSLQWHNARLHHTLSLVVAVVLTEVLRLQGLRDVAIKWPNDLICGEYKLGGILIETERICTDHCEPNLYDPAQPTRDLHGDAGIGDAESQKACEIQSAHWRYIIGIGINFSAAHPLCSTAFPTISVCDLCRAQQRTMPQRVTIIAAIVNQLTKALNLLMHSGFAAFHARWNQYACHLHTEVMLSCDLAIKYGIFRGVNAQGALLLSHCGITETITDHSWSLRPVAKND